MQAGPLGPTIAPLGPPGGPQLPGLLGALGMGMGLGGMGGAAGPPDGSPPQQPAGAGYGGGAVGGAGRTDSSGSGSPPQAVTSPLSLTPPGLPSPDGPMFNCPRRPNLGREGRAIVLRANHFQVTNCIVKHSKLHVVLSDLDAAGFHPPLPRLHRAGQVSTPGQPGDHPDHGPRIL